MLQVELLEEMSHLRVQEVLVRGFSHWHTQELERVKICLTHGTAVSRCIERITFEFTSVAHLDSLLEDARPYPTTLKSVAVSLASPNPVMLPDETSGSVTLKGRRITLEGSLAKLVELEAKSAFTGEFSLITYTDDMLDYVAVTLAALEVSPTKFPKKKHSFSHSQGCLEMSIPSSPAYQVPRIKGTRFSRS